MNYTLKFGFIYKIYDLSTNKNYIGSTTRLNERINQHKFNKSFTTCKEIINNNNYDFEILETIKFKFPQTLKILESWYILNNDCVNKKNPLTSKDKKKEYLKKWRRENKEKIKRDRDIYRKKNKDKLDNYKREKIICECGCITTRDSIIRHKRSLKHNKIMNTIIYKNELVSN